MGRRFFSWILLAALLATGCRSVAASSPETGLGVDDPASSTIPFVEEGISRVGASGIVDLDTVSPLRLTPESSPVEIMAANLLFGTLVEADDAGVVGPGLAKAFWVGPDGMRIGFELGAHTFSDGADISSGTVKASLENVVAVNPTSEAAQRLQSIAGFTAFVDGEADNIAGIVMVDDRTVVLTLSVFDEALLGALARPVYAIVDPASPTTASGDYEIVEATPDLLSLSSRDGSGDGIAFVRASNGALLAGLDAGRLDFAYIDGLVVTGDDSVPDLRPDGTLDLSLF